MTFYTFGLYVACTSLYLFVALNLISLVMDAVDTVYYWGIGYYWKVKEAAESFYFTYKTHSDAQKTNLQAAQKKNKTGVIDTILDDWFWEDTEDEDTEVTHVSPPQEEKHVEKDFCVNLNLLDGWDDPTAVPEPRSLFQISLPKTIELSSPPRKVPCLKSSSVQLV